MAKDTRQTWQKREVPAAPTVSRHNDMAFSLIFGLIDQSTWKRILLTCFVVRLTPHFDRNPCGHILITTHVKAHFDRNCEHILIALVNTY